MKQLKHPDQEMTFVDHFIELRSALIKYLIFFILAFALSYTVSDKILSWLIQPLANIMQQEQGRRLIYTGLSEAFVTHIKSGIWGGFMLSFPVLSYQISKFILPGLYKNEQKILMLILIFAPVLFVLGSALAYYFVIPLAWQFFLNFESSALITNLPVQLEAKISEYFSMILQLLIAFGLCFQLPLVLILLMKLRIVSRQSLCNKRHYAIIIILIISAFLTPPDVLSMMGLAIPLYLLYEVSLHIIRK